MNSHESYMLKEWLAFNSARRKDWLRDTLALIGAAAIAYQLLALLWVLQ